MASWTEPPNTPECRSLQPHSTFKLKKQIMLIRHPSRHAEYIHGILNHSKSINIKQHSNQSSPPWRSSRFLSVRRWCRVWFCPANSCQRCRHSRRLLRKCLYEQTPVHPGPPSQTPPCPRSRIWCWWEAPAAWGDGEKIRLCWNFQIHYHRALLCTSLKYQWDEKQFVRYCFRVYKWFETRSRWRDLV